MQFKELLLDNIVRHLSLLKFIPKFAFKTYTFSDKMYWKWYAFVKEIVSVNLTQVERQSIYNSLKFSTNYLLVKKINNSRYNVLL